MARNKRVPDDDVEVRDDTFDDDFDDDGPRAKPRRSLIRRVAVGLVFWVVAAVMAVVLVLGGSWYVLNRAGGDAVPDARTSGQDALWMGHAWVDGRNTQADVDSLAKNLRGTGVHDLFVHVGPLSDDGTLDPALRPRAAWLLPALRTAIPGVRVQAWLGDVVGEDRLDLDSATSRQNVVAAAGQVLDEGWDGVHLDLEPVESGDEGLLTLLADTHAMTGEKDKVLSVAAAHLEPFPGLGAAVGFGPGRLALWSPQYLTEVAVEVDQVAIMSYDTAIRGEQAYAGYVRRTTERALEAVPADVSLLIGLPAYHDEKFTHPDSETVGAGVRGVRLALGDRPAERPFGVALYVDFDATMADWDAYQGQWVR